MNEHCSHLRELEIIFFPTLALRLQLYTTENNQPFSQIKITQNHNCRTSRIEIRPNKIQI